MENVERVGREKINREKGFLYYIGKDGYVWRTSMQTSKGRKEKVGKEHIQVEYGYVYFLDKEGYAARTKHENILKEEEPNREIKSSLKYFIIGIFLILFPFILEIIANMLGYVVLAVAMFIFPVVGVISMVSGLSGIFSGSLKFITGKKSLGTISRIACTVISIILVLVFTYYIIMWFISLYHT